MLALSKYQGLGNDFILMEGVVANFQQRSLIAGAANL